MKRPTLSLRELNKTDFHNLYSLHGDPEIMKYISNGIALTKEQCLAKLNQYIKEQNDSSELGCWAIEDSETNEFIGMVMIKYFKGIIEPGLGYSILQKYFGMGITTEACEMIIQRYFNKSDFKNLWAITSPENIGSIKVLEKLGFKLKKQELYLGLNQSTPQFTNFYALKKICD